MLKNAAAGSQFLHFEQGHSSQPKRKGSGPLRDGDCKTSYSECTLLRANEALGWKVEFKNAEYVSGLLFTFTA